MPLIQLAPVVRKTKSLNYYRERGGVVRDDYACGYAPLFCHLIVDTNNASLVTNFRAAEK